MSSARARAQKIHFRLLSAYGTPAWRPNASPADELVATILSQNTNDANRDRAFRRLKERFPSWEAALAAPDAEVIDAIRPAGLGPQKGPRIRSVLYTIKKERGRIELDFLRGLAPEEARAWLRALPGVGPKTAAIVMLFALGLPAFPVDTHVHRVTGRLGLLPPKMTADAAHDRLAKLFDPDQYAAAHLNLIRLGREVCHPRNPDCPHCPVRRMCPYYRTQNTSKTPPPPARTGRK
jgi:endonuclease-3